MAEAELTRFIKADLPSDLFIWTVAEAAIAEAELFDGKLVLLTNEHPEKLPPEALGGRSVTVGMRE